MRRLRIMIFALGFLLNLHAQAKTCDVQLLDQDKSLLLRNPMIVNSKEAKDDWSFWRQLMLLKKVDQTPDEFFHDWLSQWEDVGGMNQFYVDKRPARDLLDFWETNSDGSLNPERSPFILSAIVPRFDLLESQQYPNGQLRFIYNLVDRDTEESLFFSVIFEYALPQLPASEDSWQQQFANLSCRGFGDSYNQTLARMIAKVLHQAKSNLLQVRTNEALLAPIWQTREFILSSGKLTMNLLPLTPAGIFDRDRSTEFSDYIKSIESDVQKNQYKLAPKYLSGIADQLDEAQMWEFSGKLSENLRRTIAVNSCNGCHGGETLTRFNHIEPRQSEGESRISDFLADDLRVRKMLMIQALDPSKALNTDLIMRRRIH